MLSLLSRLVFWVWGLKMWVKRLMLAALLSLPIIALAQTDVTVLVSWNHPTTRTDASALDEADIKIYRIRVYDGQTVGDPLVLEAYLPGGQESMSIRALETYITDAGDSPWWMTLEINCVDTLDQEGIGETLSFDIRTVWTTGVAPPNAVINLFIQKA